MAIIPRKLRRHQSGQALVEFALVLLFVILPVTLVLMDAAMMLFTYVSMTNAAREAAHAGSIYQYNLASYPADYATIDNLRYSEAIVPEAQTIGSPLIPWTECYIPPPVYTPADPGTQNIFRALDSMSVTIECPHKLLFGLGSLGQITLTAESTMRIEPGTVAPPP